MDKLLIVGAGGHGCSVAEAAILSGQYEVVGFVDDGVQVGSKVLQLPVLGAITDLPLMTHLYNKAIVAIGDNRLRESISAQLTVLGLDLVSVIHPKAIVSSHALIGAGTAVMAGAIIGVGAKLGLGVIVNCGAVVDHHATVADFGHLGVNACMSGGAVMGCGAWMQAGSVIGSGMQLSAGKVLKPGATL